MLYADADLELGERINNAMQIEFVKIKGLYPILEEEIADLILCDPDMSPEEIFQRIMGCIEAHFA